jgi:hypothetical protein
MKNEKVIQEYINNFRREFSPLLKPGIGMVFRVFPAENEGAILEIDLEPKARNEDIYMEPELTVNKALSNIKQSAFGGNLEGFKFGGTNTILEPNKIIFIKGEDDKSIWDTDAVKEDIKTLVNTISPPPKWGEKK